MSSFRSENPSQHAPAGEVPAGMHTTYWSDAAGRDRARLELYRYFLRPGDLAFDIGANVGEVTGVLLAMGCRVVAVEPQHETAQYIPPGAAVVEAVCAAELGEVEFWETPANRYLSTARRDIADRNVATNGAWTPSAGLKPTTTLDALVAEYGLPAFVKIDVEGYETEVLRGLSHALPALSFEVHSFDQAKIGACMQLLGELGDYGYLYSPLESYRVEVWPPRALGFFGDVYATLRAEPRERALEAVPPHTLRAPG